ncbi:MAG: flagellar biosynthetic protein FliO [Cyanobacteria bacterium RUI128]|nr:flagellar biosynthetic protein FliO [Cyanobacteria bacterium RUI128]
MGYLAHFIVYFLAMIGIIILALYVYQKFNIGTVGGKRANNLRIEDSLSLSPRKTLYVIRNGNERFLIAGDLERTTLISKLENGAGVNEYERTSARNFHKADLSETTVSQQDNIAPIRKPMMKEIRSKLNF